MEVYQGHDLSKIVRHFRAQRYNCFGVPKYSSDKMAEPAGNVCGQWREGCMYSEGLQ